MVLFIWFVASYIDRSFKVCNFGGNKYKVEIDRVLEEVYRLAKGQKQIS